MTEGLIEGRAVGLLDGRFDGFNVGRIWLGVGDVVRSEEYKSQDVVGL